MVPPTLKTCACGCDETISPTATWVSGHDSIALHHVLWTRYGLTEDFIRAHGFGDGPGLVPVPHDDDDGYGPEDDAPPCIACNAQPCDGATKQCPYPQHPDDAGTAR